MVSGSLKPCASKESGLYQNVLLEFTAKTKPYCSPLNLPRSRTDWL